MFELKPTKIPGCFELLPRVHKDIRGRFVKVFQKDFFKQNGLETCFSEEYYSFSHQGVIRGMHFQLPPCDHVKLVYCVSGEVLDVVFDLRKESPTYGHFEVIKVNASMANCVYIPKGLAHGFYTSSQAIMVYNVSTVYSPHYDAGILWNSFGMVWPIADPIISARDQSFPAFDVFDSPFSYKTMQL